MSHTVSFYSIVFRRCWPEMGVMESFRFVSISLTRRGLLCFVDKAFLAHDTKSHPHPAYTLYCNCNCCLGALPTKWRVIFPSKGRNENFGCPDSSHTTCVFCFFSPSKVDDEASPQSSWVRLAQPRTAPLNPSAPPLELSSS